MDRYFNEEPMPARIPGPRIFISYSSLDATFAERLARELQTGEFDVWIDRSDIKPGASLPSALDKGLATCGVFVPVLTPSSLASPWCRAEIDAALVRSTDDSNLVIMPVLLEDCPIPPLLNRLVRVDFRDSFERGAIRMVDALGQLLDKQAGADAGEQSVSTAADESINVFVIFSTSGERFSFSLPLNLRADLAAQRILGERYLAELPKHRRDGYLASGSFALKKGSQIFGKEALVKEMALNPGDELQIASYLEWPWIHNAMVADGYFRAHGIGLAIRPAYRFSSYVRDVLKKRLEADGLAFPPV